MPVAVDGAGRKPQVLGYLLQAEPAEETQFNDPGLTFVQARQLLQRLVEREQVEIRLWKRQLLLEYRLSRMFQLQGEAGTIEGDGYLNVDLKAEGGY